MPDVGYLDNDLGQRSAMRLMCVIGLGASVLFGLLAMLMPGAAQTGLYLAGMYATLAYGGKAVQRFIEGAPHQLTQGALPPKGS